MARPSMPRGAALADVERKVAITPATHFRLGSITKQFTAAAIMKLVEQGKVSLDDPLVQISTRLSRRLGLGDGPAIAQPHRRG